MNGANKLENKEPYLLGGYSSVSIDNNWYFWSTTVDALVAAEADGSGLRVLFQILPDDSQNGPAYSFVEKWKEKVIIAPFHSKRICIYDTASGEKEYYDLDREGLFSSIYIFEDVACFWGWGKGAVLLLDLKSKEIIHVEAMNDVVISSNACPKDDSLIGYNKNSQKVFELNIPNRSYKELDLFTDGMNINSFCFYKDYLWMSGDKNEVIKYNWKNDTSNIIRAKESTTSDLKLKDYYRSAEGCGDYIYFSPYKAKQMLRINCMTNEAYYPVMLEEDELGGGFLFGDNNRMVWMIEATGENRVLSQYQITTGGEVIRFDSISLRKGSLELIDLLKHNTIETEDYGLVELLKTL